MPKPEQTAEPHFPKLHQGVGQESTGTVTGKHIAAGDTVHLVSRNSNKKWDGTITSVDSGDTWKAKVKRIPHVKREDERPLGLETVTVTVTNTSGDSNPADTQSDVVP